MQQQPSRRQDLYRITAPRSMIVAEMNQSGRYSTEPMPASVRIEEPHGMQSMSG
jgi:hypothetical protein